MGYLEESASLNDSYGAFWLESIQANWNLVPAWTVWQERSERCHDDDVHLTPSQTHGVISQQEYMEITGNKVVLNLSGSANMKHVEPGDFIIHLRSFQGGLEYSKVSGKVSNAYTVLRPAIELVPSYFRWLFKSAPFISGLAGSTDQLRDGQSINFKKFSTFSLPLPDLATQRRIADRLDRETGEIDSLVKELGEYVGLLERRKKAVTRNSLDEISGEQPSKVRLHMFCSFVSGVGFPLDEQGIEDEEYPFLKVSSLTRTLEGRSTIKDRSNCVSKETAERLGASIISPGSILLAKIGEAARLMRIRAVDSNCCIDNNLLAIIPDESVADSDFLRHALSGLRPTLLLTPGTIPTINMSVLRNFSIPLPDLETQRRIADRLDRETTETEALIKECTALKELLLKRRQVLITDMVTGKVEA